MASTRRLLTLIFATSFALLDVAVVTILYPQHMNNFMQYFVYGFQHYNHGLSMMELWVSGLLRMTLMIGAVVGVLGNPQEGPRKCAQLQPVVLLVVCVIMGLSVVKLLIVSEFVDQFQQNVLFWALFSWSLTASVIFALLWNWLANLKTQDPSRINVNNECNVNFSEGERQPLLAEGYAEDSVDNEKTDIPNNEKASTVGRLIGLSKPDWPYVSIALLFMTVSSVAEIFAPWFTGQVIQGIAIDRDEAKFTRPLVMMAVFSALSSVSAGIRGGFFKVTMARLNIRIRNQLFSAILTQEIGFFDTTQTGDITSRLTSDTTIVSDALNLNTNIFLRNIIKAVGICVFMVKISWRLSMITVIGLPVIIGVSKVYGTFYENLTKKVQDTLAKANSVADEVCSTMRTVRSFANEREESSRYDNRLQETYKLKKTEALAFAGYMWSTELFSLSLVVATLYYGGHLVIANLLSGGELVSFILYQTNLGFALESISSVYTGLMEAVGASFKVFEYVDRKPSIPNDGKLAPEELKGHIEFKNVTFSYPSRLDSVVLKDVSFTVKPGEVVALVGPSGGGKSSCVNLLEHFYEPLSGSVLLDGVPIQSYDHKFLHEKISLVGQEPVLYARSIRENIAYGLDNHVDIAQIRHAADMANASQFIADMKDKYNTETGEKGLQLSGGQKQRIAIARAVIRNPVILLLDEATSALDSESEHVVQQAMHKNLDGRTVVLIAHRLSTVERADRIIVINKGHVVEEGTHGQLHKAGGLYSKLVQRQLLGSDQSFGADEEHKDGEELEERNEGWGARKQDRDENVAASADKEIQRRRGPEEGGGVSLSRSLTGNIQMAESPVCSCGSLNEAQIC